MENPTLVSENPSPRGAIAAILAISAVALAFLFWLIYFNPGTDAFGDVSFLPAVNAALNSLSAISLLIGFSLIKKGRVDQHQKAMLTAFLFSTLFLISYIIYHSAHGDTPFQGQGFIRPVYFAILISHIVLSIAALPVILTTFFLSLTGRIPSHRKLARFTFPLWLYVSVSGVLVFLLLRFFGSP